MPGHAARAAGSARGQGPWLTDGFAKPLSVDESSIKHLPDVKVVRQGDFVGVVGPVEYEVVQAAAQLKVKWAESPILPGSREPLERASARPTRPGRCRPASPSTSGNFDTAFKAAAKTVSASFYVPLQRPQADRPGLRGRRLQGARRRRTRTRSRSSSNTQNVVDHGADIAATLGLQPARTRCAIIFYEGSSSFGNGYHYLDITRRPR